MQTSEDRTPKPRDDEKGDKQFLISLANLPQDLKEQEFQAAIKELGIQFTACKVTSVEGSNPTAIIWFKNHNSCKSLPADTVCLTSWLSWGGRQSAGQE